MKSSYLLASMCAFGLMQQSELRAEGLMCSVKDSDFSTLHAVVYQVRPGVDRELVHKLLNSGAEEKDLADDGYIQIIKEGDLDMPRSRPGESANSLINGTACPTGSSYYFTDWLEFYREAGYEYNIQWWPHQTGTHYLGYINQSNQQSCGTVEFSYKNGTADTWHPWTTKTATFNYQFEKLSTGSTSIGYRFVFKSTKNCSYWYMYCRD